MKNIVIYVHGKGGSAAEAEHYRQLFPDSEVIGFDYHAQIENADSFLGLFSFPSFMVLPPDYSFIFRTLKTFG